MKTVLRSHFFLLICFLLHPFAVSASPLDSRNASPSPSRLEVLVPKEKRRTLASMEYGEISAVEVDDGHRGPYHIQFITMEPNSLFLPALLQEDMLFYVQTGRGRVEWVDGENEKAREVEVQPGDIYRLRSGSVFYVKSHPNAATREKLRIHALFTKTDVQEQQVTPFGAYSCLSDLVLGFEKEVLRMAFKVPAELIEEMMRTSRPPSIIHMPSRNEINSLDWKGDVPEILVGDGSQAIYNGNGKKRMKAFNILRKEPDVQNCNGQSLAVTSKDFHPLKASDIGMFMVNLTKGSMMAPHWNPRATEIAIVVHGQGMIRIVCSSNATKCTNSRFRVKEGDVFVVPRFHSMTHLSFNNDSLIFVGFSTRARRNRPQFLAGTRSVLQTMDLDILAMSFNITNPRMKQLLVPQKDFILLECTSCAEEEEQRMKEEERQKKQEEERKRKEEEEKKREDEEAARKKREEEETRKKKEEEERKKREEEEAREKREEEEEARKKREKEERQKREEEEARKKREEKERKKREEEEEKKREEEARERREEEERRKRKEREAAEKSRRRKKEAAARTRVDAEDTRRQAQHKREREKREKGQARRRKEKEESGGGGEYT